MSEPTVLGCGRTLDDVWAGADRPPDRHELSCPDCRAARASLARLRVATDGLREDESALAPTSLKESVMAVARAEVRRGRTLPVRTTDDGPIVVSELAVGAQVRAACDRVPGIRARRCTVRLHRPDAADGPVLAEADTAEVDVSLGVAAAFGQSVPAALEALRAEVGVALTDRIGVVARRIDITVEDLYGLEAS